MGDYDLETKLSNVAFPKVLSQGYLVYINDIVTVC